MFVKRVVLQQEIFKQNNGQKKGAMLLKEGSIKEVKILSKTEGRILKIMLLSIALVLLSLTIALTGSAINNDQIVIIGVFGMVATAVASGVMIPSSALLFPEPPCKDPEELDMEIYQL